MRRYTIKQFDKQFPNDDACLAYLFKARWPRGRRCPTCEKVTKHYRRSDRKTFACEWCGGEVSPTADTIFHKSPTPLRLWFYAMYLMASTRCGISAKQLERELGVTYKTAWRMFKQIRTLMGEEFTDMSGPVEADESYFGGKVSPSGRGQRNKTIVFGVVERGGRARTHVVRDNRTQTLLPAIWKRVPAYAGHIVYTDEWSGYTMLHELGYKHETVTHSLNIYVKGSAHTNTIEGLWSLMKRGIGGVYHAVSRKYLQTYLDEYTFRYNRRADETPMFLALLARIPALAGK